MPEAKPKTKAKNKATELKHTGFSKRNILVFAIVFALIGGYAIYRSFAAGSNIYVDQSQAGSGSGNDCADAKAATFFNSSANWGTGSTQIGPGTVVHLCGTITSPLGVNGSGAAGNPITILFESGAKLSESYCSPTSGCLQINGQSYITIDGNHVGIIESTANGMALANQQNAMGIYLQNTSNIIIQNLTIQNLFVHSSCTVGIQANCDLLSSKSQYAIEDYDGNNNRVTGNTIHDTQLGIYYRTDSGFGQNMRADHNEFYDIDNPVNQTYSFGGGTTGPFFFNNNYSHDFGNWDAIDKSNPSLWGWAYHHDGLHCYTSANGTGAAVHTVGNYYYDNKFVVLAPQMGAGFTSFFFLEGGSGPGATPCDDSTSNNYLFNNDLIDNGAGPAETPPAAHGNGVSNGVMCPCAGSINHVWNNTMIGASNNGGGPSIFQMATSSSELKNNVITTGDQLIHASPGFASGSPDYNIYANGSQNGNTWVCGSSFIGSLSGWQSCIGSAGDAHSSYAASAQLNTDGTPQAGSPVLSAGTNLSSLCSGFLTALCQDYNGNARPASGAWDVGAFQGSGSGGGGGGDTTAPTVSFTAPANGATVSGSSVTLSANASDNVSVASVEFDIGVGAKGGILGPITHAPYTATWDTTGYGNGSYQLIAVVTDSSGNTNSSTITVTVSNSVAPGCTQSSTSWQNQSITNQTGSFNADFDSTPSSNNMDGVTGLSSGPASDYTNLATIVRFNSSGFIDAINGAGYASSSSIAYNAGTGYHFKLVVNVGAHTYSIYVTPQGGSQITLGTNYSFRTDQAGVSSLNNLALLAEASSHTVCSLSLSTGTTTVPGDTNGDGHVTITDLSTVLSHFGQSGQSLSTGDTNGDGSVTIADLSAVLSHFGQ